MVKVTVLSAMVAAGLVLASATPVNAAEREESTVTSSALKGAQGRPEQNGPRYAALGDSFAAGTGAGDYADRSLCFRSRQAYPLLVSKQRNSRVSFLACAGQTTSQITVQQVSVLDSATTLVTLQAGGNDAGFAPATLLCMQPETRACLAAISKGELFIKNVLPNRLRNLYRLVRLHAPRAQVMVVGYPRLFATLGSGCWAAPNLTRQEMDRLNQVADLFESVISRAAHQSGAEYVSALSAFDGHGLCDREPWIQGASKLTEASLHPNDAGNQAYARLVLDHRGASGKKADEQGPSEPAQSGPSSATTADSMQP